jgi:hypothetical protein
MCRDVRRYWVWALESLTGDSLVSNVTFDVRVNTLQGLDTLPTGVTDWHAPSPCGGAVVDVASSARLGLPVHAVCVSSPCDGRGCNLTLALLQARQYVLSVRLLQLLLLLLLLLSRRLLNPFTGNPGFVCRMQVGVRTHFVRATTWAYALGGLVHGSYRELYQWLTRVPPPPCACTVCSE